MENGNAIVLLRNRFDSLKGVQRSLAELILSDMNSFVGMNIKDMAEKANVAQSSVVRFYQSLGFQEYSDFKINIAKNLEQQNVLESHSVQKKDTIKSIMEKTAFISIQAINDSMRALDMTTLSQAIDWLSKARRIDFYGMGSSSMLVHDCYYRIMRIGYPCFFATDPHIMRTSANFLDKHGIAFVISYTGRSNDPLRALEIAKQRGAKTICLTGFQNSPISQAADCSILCISNETKTLGESYSNTVAQKIILDGIYNCLAAKKTTIQKQEELCNLLEETRL